MNESLIAIKALDRRSLTTLSNTELALLHSYQHTGRHEGVSLQIINDVISVNINSNEQPIILDPYIIKATQGIQASEIFDALLEIYSDIITEVDRAEFIPLINKWMGKLWKKPSLALSTGGRNSYKGLFTCALLHTMKVLAPKATRVRMHLAWSILDSEIAIQRLSPIPAELEQAQLERSSRYSPIIPGTIPPKPTVFKDNDLNLGCCFSGEKNDVRRIIFLDGMYVYYEGISAQPSNHYGHREGVSEDGYPVFKSLKKPFLAWAKRLTSIESTEHTEKAIPKHILGSIFTINSKKSWLTRLNGVKIWFTKIKGKAPIYYMLLEHRDGGWGHRNVMVNYDEATIMCRPEPNTSFLIYEHNEIVQLSTAP
jgi:hypothetical protein